MRKLQPYEKRLINTGWLRPGDDVSAEVIRRYQGFHGLLIDGDAGPVTQAHLGMRRICALPDKLPMREAVQFPQKDVTWHPAEPVRPFNHTQTVQIFKWGFSRWAQVCGIRPKYEPNAQRANVLARVGNIDGPAGTLAWSELANWPRTNQRYDDSEQWYYSGWLSNPPAAAIELGAVVVHELGHALGIPHLGNGNVMQPMYQWGLRTPQDDDIRQARARYGRPATQPEPPPAPPKPEPPPADACIQAILDLLEALARR